MILTFSSRIYSQMHRISGSLREVNQLHPITWPRTTRISQTITHSPNPLDILKKLPTSSESRPQPNKTKYTNEVIHFTKDTSIVINSTRGSSKNSASSWRSGQSTNTGDGKHSAHAKANFFHWRDTHDEAGLDQCTRRSRYRRAQQK
jgi:hypothetical protein